MDSKSEKPSKEGKAIDYSTVDLCMALADSRKRFDGFISELKNGGDVEQSLEFSVAKVAAELESLECLLKEIQEPSNNQTLTLDKVELGYASVGKLLPHFLVNLDKLAMQCGLDTKGSNPALISGLFEKNYEFTQILTNKL